MGRAILSKSLTQFSVEKRGCVLSLFFDLRPNYGGGDEDNEDLLQRSRDALLCSVPPALQQATPTHASTGDSRASLGQSPVGSLLLSPGPWGPQGPPHLYLPSGQLLEAACFLPAVQFLPPVSQGRQLGWGLDPWEGARVWGFPFQSRILGLTYKAPLK